MEKKELAIATDFAGEAGRLEETEHLLKSISEAGFTHIHWCHEWEGDYTYSKYEMYQIRDWMERYGLKAKALHASKGSRRNVNLLNGHYRKDYTSDWEYNRKAGVELIQNRIDLAKCLGAEEIVLHLYPPYQTFRTRPDLREPFYARVKRSFDELQPYCREQGIRICLENLFDMPADYVTDQWDMLLQEYPPEYMGICLDTGHGYMSWGENLPNIIEKYRDRIYSVHLHDNNRTVDYHLLPGEGEIDWHKVMQELAQSTYRLPLTLEVNCQEDDREAFLRRAYQAGMMIQKYYDEGLNE